MYALESAQGSTRRVLRDRLEAEIDTEAYLSSGLWSVEHLLERHDELLDPLGSEIVQDTGPEQIGAGTCVQLRGDGCSGSDQMGHRCHQRHAVQREVLSEVLRVSR